MAPEYAMEGLFSVKSDVFSYGVLVLEIICGKKNSGFYLSECGQSLTLYVSFQCYQIKVLEQNLILNVLSSHAYQVINYSTVLTKAHETYKIVNYLQAWKVWCAGKCLELMDPVLEECCVESEVVKCIHIGLLCVQEDAADRPTMSTVVVMLASDMMSLPKPNQPAFSVGRMTLDDASTSKSSKNLSINDDTVSNIFPR